MTDTVGGILIRDGEVLLGRRAAHKSYPGAWDMIGGHVEPGETSWQALCRELMEEVGIDAIEGDPLDTITLGGSVLDIYRISSWHGDPVACNDEHTEIQWFPLDAAACLPDLLTPDYSKLLATLSEQERGAAQPPMT